MNTLQFFAFFLISGSLVAAERPNILWITAEDMSATLGCYGDDFAITPNIDRLAQESVRYTHAFASAPVCSPARSCLITGCYATSLGTHNMRSAFRIPESIEGFPTLLRKAGYYTSNNVKTDYNTASWQRIVRDSWNESSDTAHWRNREEDEQPFFSVFNLMTSHQSRSMVWPYDQFKKEVQSRLRPQDIHDPGHVPVPPYYPDTPIVRKTIARFYDCVTAMDQEVGEILNQLEQDGLADETIVFFFSDHGTGLPRHKRALLDSGMHVPLLIHFPDKYKHLAPALSGQQTDRLVSFVDFGPTTLSLAGIEVSEVMQGQPFLGAQASPPRKYVFGHRDRVDEAIDLARSVRSQRYLYIRNYMPHLSYNQPTAWPDLGEIRHEFYRLTDKSALSPAQWHFAGPTRPLEELYDCEADPQNINNLVESKAHAGVLEELRRAHREHVAETLDVGFIPEPLAWRWYGENTPWESARKNQSFSYLAAFEAAEKIGFSSESELVDLLESANPAIQYWATEAAAGLPSLSKPVNQLLIKNLKSELPSVAIASADALCRHGQTDTALPVLIDLLKHEDFTVVLHAARAVELLGETAVAAIPAMQQVLQRSEEIRPAGTPATFVQSGEQDLAMFASFAAKGFLSRVSVGWVDLFDGKTLDGWSSEVEGNVEVVDGEIRILSHSKNLWLTHQDEFSDFELKVEVLVPKSGYNSGIGFRCQAHQNGKSSKKLAGYQCEIENQKSGMIYAIGSGRVWPKSDEQRKKFEHSEANGFVAEEWNRFRIRCQGAHLQIWINDVQTTDVVDERFSQGVIALQHHGKGDVHRFRNIRLRDFSKP